MISLILNYNDYHTTLNLVKLLESFNVIEFIVIVDNNSTDNSFNELLKIKNDKVDIIRNSTNNGYGGGNNFGIRYIKQKYGAERILLCNPDVIIDEKTIVHLEEFLKSHLDYAIVAPFMLNRNGIKQYNTAFRVPKKWDYIFSIGMITSKLTNSFYYNDIEKLDCDYFTVGAVAGSLFMMNVDHMLAYGMYDENMFLYCEETVLAIKFKNANIKTALMPKYTFIHNHSVSINKSFSNPVKKRKLLLNSKLYVIKNYYNANVFEYICAKILYFISIFELSLWSIIKQNGVI